MPEKQLNSSAQTCLQQLMREWFNFERRLNRVPVIHRLETGRFNMGDYQSLLLNLRQQVIEGSRWISRSASSFEREFADVRSIVIGHAREEHRDYEILERDYVATGGEWETIQHHTRNPGSEALHAFLMYRASLPNPIDMLGAMWIIEGLGQKMASSWAKRIDELTDGDGRWTQFMRYHGENDDEHMEKLYQMLDRVCRNEENVRAIVQTARVVGRLYALQLEEIDEQ